MRHLHGMRIRGRAFGVISSGFSNRRNQEKIDVIFAVVRTEPICSGFKILLAEPWNFCIKEYMNYIEKEVYSYSDHISEDPCLVMMLDITLVAWRNKCIIWNKVGKKRISEEGHNRELDLWVHGKMWCVGGGKGGREGRTHWGSGKSCGVRVMYVVRSH